ncbi:MAG: ABC transporter permease [Solirubrobacteraceae bacterium]|nr:ABC transporter permease [Solirubrobacteraceae bacterium]
MSTRELLAHDYRPVKRRLRVRDIWASWRITRMVAARDIRVKYKQAALGPLWLILAPLGMLGAVTVAFSGVTSVQTQDVPYVLFALAGLTMWTFVQLGLMIAPQGLIGNSALVRRSACPRLALVQGAVIANSPPVIVMGVISLLWAGLDRGVTLQMLLLPLVAAWLFVLVWGLALLAAPLAARARDIVSVVPLAVQAGLFVTPVGYPLAGSPANIQTLLTLNPVTGIIEAWRWALLGMDPDSTAMLVSGAMTLLIAWFGWRLFTRTETTIADYV